MAGHDAARDRQPVLRSRGPRRPAAPPEPVGEVAAEYRKLVGEHEAHPGTGKGYGAIARARADANV